MFTIQTCTDRSEEVLQLMAKLFSEHYGIWSAQGPRPGERVKLSASALRSGYLFDNDCKIILAKDASTGDLIGQLLYRVFPFQSGQGVWITQLVVHSAWRSQKIAAHLIAIMLAEIENLVIVGMATSHPHAVKALGRIMGVRFRYDVASSIAIDLIKATGIPYINGCNLRIDPISSTSIINTRFYVDHSEVNEIRGRMPNWNYGSLDEGEEYLVILVRDSF